MEACRQFSLPPSKLWGWSILTAVSSAILIAIVSVRRGPAIQPATLAIPRAQGAVAMAREAYTGVKPQALRNAEAALSSAHAALAERRYEGAVTAAARVWQVAKESLEQPPPGPTTATGKTFAKKLERSTGHAACRLCQRFTWRNIG
jgi:hypothetical protein